MDNIPRAETGVMQFEKDWPGVFIRGDNAAYFAMCLRNVLPRLTTDPLTHTAVRALTGLASLLESSNVANKPQVQYASDFIGPCYCCRDRGKLGCSDGCLCNSKRPEDADDLTED